jgi:lipoprotein-anchoring transpeptidase ErfK/SrfK
VAGNGTFGTCGAPETEPSGAIIEVRVWNNLGRGFGMVAGHHHTMRTGRLAEIIGAFLLGGGAVALGYEFGGLRSTDPGRATEEPSLGAHAGAAGAGGIGSTRTGAAVVGEAVPAGPPYLTPDDEGSYAGFGPIHLAPEPFDAAAESAFPAHGLITTMGAIVRERADRQSPILGILRSGTRIRVDAERTFGGRCKKGWHRLFPKGWMCRDAGLVVEEGPPEVTMPLARPPMLDDVLPYEYWRVKDEMTPFFHRLPTYTEQDRADAAGRAWAEEHGRKPMPTRYSDRPSDVPAVVKEYQNAGYWVTKAGEEVRLKRRFLRTLRGTYARKYQLQLREASEFRGALIGDPESLPIYFIRRELPLMKRETPDSDVLVPSEQVPARRSTYAFVRSVHIGVKEYYEDADGLLMRSYAVGKVTAIKRAPGIGADEHWLHVDLSEQILVAYVGDRPVFATLVSTGREPGMTPVGVFRIQSKYIATSMRDQPPEEEAYSIEDVPWTQYFSNNVALHGAFWHGGFGIVRSHGCVNLSPADARWLFGFTQPALPADWHAVMPGVGKNGQGSAVVVTE